MSGITVNASCAEAWNDMKLKHKHMFVTFKIENDQEVVVDTTGAKNATYQMFTSALPADDCRYAVVEVPGTTKLVFIMWAPDTASVKSRMIYASTRQVISDKLSGHQKTVQATDLSDIEEAKVKKLVS